MLKPTYVDMTKWDRRFMSMCALIAEWSEDRSRKVAAVIVGPSNEVRSIGYNGLPRQINALDDNRHVKENGEKYYWFEHAERNAIYNAARAGISTAGCRMYSSLFPCADCSRAVIQSGIVQLCTFDVPEADPTFGRSFEVSQTLLREAGVEVRIFHRE